MPNIGVPSRVFHIPRSITCTDLTSKIIGRVGVLLEENNDKGEFRFDALVWIKYKSHFKETHDKKKRHVPALLWNNMTESFSFGEASFRIAGKGNIGCQPVIQWRSTHDLKPALKESRWKVEAFRFL